MSGVFMFYEYGREIISCFACMATCSLVYWLQQWLDKDAQSLKKAINPSLKQNPFIQNSKTEHQQYKVFGGRRSFLWPQDLNVLNNIMRWKEGRRRLSEELIAKLKLVGILRKPPKNLSKVQISDSAFYSGQSLKNDIDVVFLSNVGKKKKKNIIYQI